jgi:hypothetical protein
MAFRPEGFRDLREFSGRLPDSKEAHRLFHELLNDPNDRAAGITAASYLERSLEETLTHRFKKIGATSVDEIFRGAAPLGTFAAKIKFAFSIGLLGERAQHDFNCIREIRNAFAHSKLRATFETKEIQSVCWQIGFPKWPSGPGARKREERGSARIHFAGSCTLYSEMLAEMATPGNHALSKRFLGR